MYPTDSLQSKYTTDLDTTDNVVSLAEKETLIA